MIKRSNASKRAKADLFSDETEYTEVKEQKVGDTLNRNKLRYEMFGETKPENEVSLFDSLLENVPEEPAQTVAEETPHEIFVAEFDTGDAPVPSESTPRQTAGTESEAEDYQIAPPEAPAEAAPAPARQRRPRPAPERARRQMMTGAFRKVPPERPAPTGSFNRVPRDGQMKTGSFNRVPPETAAHTGRFDRAVSQDPYRTAQFDRTAPMRGAKTRDFERVAAPAAYGMKGGDTVAFRRVTPGRPNVDRRPTSTFDAAPDRSAQSSENENKKASPAFLTKGNIIKIAGVVASLLLIAVILILVVSGGKNDTKEPAAGESERIEETSAPEEKQIPESDIIAGEDTPSDNLVEARAGAGTLSMPNRYNVRFTFYDRPDFVCNTESVKAGDLMSALGFPSGDERISSVDDDTVIDGDTSIELKTVSTEYDYETEEIPYDTKYVDDDTIPLGEEQVSVEGAEGVKTYTYLCTLVNGVELSRELVSEDITSEPVDKVISRGTYVAPAPQPQPQPSNQDSSSIEHNVTVPAYVTSGGPIPIATPKSPAGTPSTIHTGIPKEGEYLYYVDVRAYCYDIVGPTYTGIHTGDNVMAVDPNVIPLGSECVVIGDLGDYGHRIAADIGGGIKGNTIDIWVPSYAIFGVQNCRVYVLG